MIANATVSACGASTGTVSTTARNRSLMVASPMAPLMMPMLVMPTCTRRQEPCRLRRQLQRDRGATAALFGELVQPHAARTDNRDLGEREETVEQDETEEQRDVGEHENPSSKADSQVRCHLTVRVAGTRVSRFRRPRTGGSERTRPPSPCYRRSGETDVAGPCPGGRVRHSDQRGARARGAGRLRHVCRDLEPRPG